MKSSKLLSVCIPSYEMRGLGATFLTESLDILLTQTFKDFEVVISDYSKDDAIEKVYHAYKNKLDIVYIKNTDPRIGLSSNTNNAISHANGKLIKILFQDDFLFDQYALEETVKNFDLEKDTWLVTGCIHTPDGTTLERPHYPKYTKKIHLGDNHIGSPSVLTIKNDHPFLFDYNLSWLVDCDYYRRYYDAFGAPKIVKKITAVIRTGDHQITNTEATEALRKKEYRYILKKYQIKSNEKIDLPEVTVVSISGLNLSSGMEAVQLSCKGINFHEAVIIGHEAPETIPHGIIFKQCKQSDLKSRDRKNTDDYSKFMLYNLHEYIESDFALIVHKNAHVLRPHKWSQEFLEYDYIGAPWPPDIHYTKDGTNVRVGNGGFCLRSKKLMNALNELKLPFTDGGTGFYHEDGVLCVYYRKELEAYGIKFAPPEVAARFSLEAFCPESTLKPFGFHDNVKALPTAQQIKHHSKQVLKKITTAR